MTQDPANFREYAGTLIASIIVCAFVAIGFVSMAIVVLHGAPAAVPSDWMAAMLSLASAALGFLIGKQTTGQPVQAASVPSIGDPVTATTDAKIVAAPKPAGQ